MHSLSVRASPNRDRSFLRTVRILRTALPRLGSARPESRADATSGLRRGQETDATESLDTQQGKQRGAHAPADMRPLRLCLGATVDGESDARVLGGQSLGQIDCASRQKDHRPAPFRRKRRQSLTVLVSLHILKTPACTCSFVYKTPVVFCDDPQFY